MIRIDISSRQPPAGRLWIDDHAPEPFEGWLQLLHLLTDALSPADPGPGPGAERLL